MNRILSRWDKKISDDLMRVFREHLKEQFLASYGEPRLELPPDSLIEDVITYIILTWEQCE